MSEPGDDRMGVCFLLHSGAQRPGFKYRHGKEWLSRAHSARVCVDLGKSQAAITKPKK